MKFNFNKKMVSTIVILIFGIAITVAALSAKNIALENKLGRTNSSALAGEEECISKKKPVELFESGTLDTLPPG